MNAIIGVLGRVGAAILASILTEKVIIRLIIILMDKLVNKTANTIDNDVWAPVRVELEKIANGE